MNTAVVFRSVMNGLWWTS